MHNEAIKMAKWTMADACAKGYDNMTSQDWDDFKDCVETAKNAIKCDYYYRLVECMKKDEEEEKREDKYFLDMLKDEHKDEYKRYMDEYGEDGERRFYDNYRYKSSGRFAPKGRGSYMPRRGYDEPPYYHMNPDYRMDLADYKGKTAEEMRDLDRKAGRLYFSTPMSDTPKHDIMRDAREGRSGEKRRGYMETKEMHKDNSPESKQRRMKDLETYAKELTEDIVEMVGDATPEEHALMKQKLQVLLQKL